MSIAHNVSEKKFCDHVYEKFFCTSVWLMLILLYLVQHKCVKYTIKISLFTVMWRKTIVCLCWWTISPVCIIFNAVHASWNITDAYKFWNIRWMFTRHKSYEDRQAQKQKIETIKIFQCCSKVLIQRSFFFFCRNRTCSFLKNETCFVW